MKLTRIQFIACLAASALGFSTQAWAKDKGLVGICMPEKTTTRWIDDGNNLVKMLKDDGYSTVLQYADDDIPNQVSQIENMITQGAKALIIAPVDGSALTTVLEQAARQKIKIIAYDRMIKGTNNVDYYATFDNVKVGALEAGSLVEALGVKEGKGPFNIELFAGSPDDSNAGYVFQGGMSVLQPLIDQKKLVVQSGQTAFNQVAILHWDGAAAQARMDNLLSAYYSNGKRVDAVLGPNDLVGMGVVASLTNLGYGKSDLKMAYVSGQDCQLSSIKSIIAGGQYSTVFKDTRELAKVVAKMTDDALSGKRVEINDTKSYNNGVKDLPTYLLQPVSVTKANYKHILIDSGYLKTSQL